MATEILSGMIPAENGIAILQCFTANCLRVAEIDYKMPSDYCPQSAYEPENAFCNRALGCSGGRNSFSYSRSRRLDSRRRGQPDENHGTVAPGIAAEVG